MADPKDNTKLSGDTHPPEVEDEQAGSPEGRPDAQGAQGTPPDKSLSHDVESEGRAGKGISQAGNLKDKGAPGAGREKRKGGKS